MKIIIFGATGGTGNELVKQALGRHHEVTAFLRDPEELAISHDSLKLVKGDVLDLSAVEASLEGQDVVVCALGKPNILDGSMLRARGTLNIVEAMKRNKLRRLICLSGMGAGDSFMMLPRFYKHFLVPILMRRLYKDHNLQEDHIRSSDLDWIIARPGNLTDGNLTGEYKHGFEILNSDMSMKISRADTADFMLKQLSDDRYLKQSPCLSY